MDINMNSIGNRIRERRKELNLTQTDIHRECGISSGALSQIENGNRVPSAIAFYSLSQVLNCSMEYLITGESSDTKNLELYGNEEKLMNGFRELSKEDQDELIEILNIKLRRSKRERNVTEKSSLSAGINSDGMVG